MTLEDITNNTSPKLPKNLNDSKGNYGMIITRGIIATSFIGATAYFGHIIEPSYKGAFIGAVVGVGIMTADWIYTSLHDHYDA